MKSKSKKKQSKRKALPPAAEIVVEKTTRGLRAKPVVLRREPGTLARVLGETTVVVPAPAVAVTTTVVRKPAKKRKRAA